MTHNQVFLQTTQVYNVDITGFLVKYSSVILSSNLWCVSPTLYHSDNTSFKQVLRRLHSHNSSKSSNP